MPAFRKQGWLAVLLLFAITLSACGSAQTESVISTRVAMTVQAQNTGTAEAQQQQPTPAVTFSVESPEALPSMTPAVTSGPPTVPPSGSAANYKPCYSATFVQDVTVPDGQIMSPGSTFIKTWRVQNDGSCTWNSTYKFVYYSGDILGGAYVYPFPQTAAPGDTVDVSIQLYAPADSGSYSGEWKIEAPDKTIFGVGQYSVPLSVKIVVGSGTPANNKTQTVYGVTNVTYDVSDRTCTTANTFYHPKAYITTNGPVTVTFKWVQSDGHTYNNRTMTFDSASTQQFEQDWSQRITSSTNPRWVQVVITSPSYSEWPKATLPILCNQIPTP